MSLSGSKLRAVRERLGLSLSQATIEIQRRSGHTVALTHLWLLENRPPIRVELRTVEDIARGYGVRVTELLD